MNPMMIGLRSFTITANQEKFQELIQGYMIGYTGLYGFFCILKREAIDTNLSTLIIPNR